MLEGGAAGPPFADPQGHDAPIQVVTMARRAQGAGHEPRRPMPTGGPPSRRRLFGRHAFGQGDSALRRSGEPLGCFNDELSRSQHDYEVTRR